MFLLANSGHTMYSSRGRSMISLVGEGDSDDSDGAGSVGESTGRIVIVRTVDSTMMTATAAMIHTSTGRRLPAVAGDGVENRRAFSPASLSICSATEAGEPRRSATASSSSSESSK